MAQSPTISIPRKKTDEVDWTSPIRTIISQSYGESPDAYSSECAALQRCRQDAVKGAGSDMTARDLLYKYFGQLELLELRFSEIKVTFPWYDAFTGKLTTQTSLAFEKASIIFQMAGTHSSIASNSTRSDPEGIKRAFHYFRTSAGMLNYINENFLHAPSTDLSRDVVKFLVGIMLAQATEVSFEKLIDEKKSGSGFNAKVAAQAAFLYSGLTDEVKEFYGKGIFDRNWVTLVQIKAKYFSALMHYHQHLFDTTKGRYGEALSRIILAEALAKEANKMAASFGPYFIPSLTPDIPADGGTAIITITKALTTLTGEKRIEAQRENDLIYNAIPVAESTLPTVEKLVVATPIPIQDVYGSPDVQKVIGPDMFAKLIPLSVHKSASIYSEEKAKLARSEAEKSESADTDFSVALASLGLPGGLQKWKDLVAGDDRSTSGALPRELETWAEEIEDAGGIAAIDKMMDKLSSAKSSVAENLGATHQGLENESRECERMRVKYEHEWTQDPSAPFTRTLRQELKSHSDSFAAASTTDEQVLKLWTSSRADLSLLLSGSESLERFFTEQERIQGGSGTNVQGSLLDMDDEISGDDAERIQLRNQVTGIDENLGRLNKIKRERAEIVKNLKEKLQTDDVSHLLLVNHRAPNAEQAVFASELEKFRPYQARLDAAIKSQETTIEEIAKTWKDVKNGVGRHWVKKAEAVEKRRGNLIGRFVQARDVWLQVRDGIGKGAEFYAQLGDLVKSLRLRVDEFIKSRIAERDSLVSQLETRRRLTSPSIPAAPPSQLPPPTSSPYDLSGHLSSVGISQWSSRKNEDAQPPQRPPPPPSSNLLYSAVPQPPPQSAYQQASKHGAPQPSSPYGTIPPPPPPLRQHHSSPPTSDPYGDLFNTPGLSSQFGLQTSPTRQGSLPPPPPQPVVPFQSYYVAQSPPPPPPHQHAQLSTYPPPPPGIFSQQQPYQQQPYYQQPFGVPPPSLYSRSSPPPPPPPPPHPWNR